MDTKMTFIVDTFAVPNQKHLRRFVVHRKIFRDLIGNMAVPDQVKIIKINTIRGLFPFQPCFGKELVRTARTVLEYHLGLLPGMTLRISSNCSSVVNSIHLMCPDLIRLR